jgi:hypothetical protein
LSTNTSRSSFIDRMTTSIVGVRNRRFRIKTLGCPIDYVRVERSDLFHSLLGGRGVFLALGSGHFIVSLAKTVSFMRISGRDKSESKYRVSIEFNPFLADWRTKYKVPSLRAA